MGTKHAKEIRRKNSTDLNEDDIEILLKHTHFCREEIIEQHKKFLVFVFNL